MAEMTPLKAIEIIQINLAEAKKMPPDVRDALRLAITHLLIAAADAPQNPLIPLPTLTPDRIRDN